MQDYVALATGPDGQPLVIVAGGNDLDQVRRASEDYVMKHQDETVAVYQRGSTVSIVCAPKWQ